jgi:hypothetical protein
MIMAKFPPNTWPAVTPARVDPCSIGWVEKRPNPTTPRNIALDRATWYWPTSEKGQLMFKPGEEVLSKKQQRKKKQRRKDQWVPQ